VDELLTDDVWCGLDPNAGRLSRRQTGWLLLAGALAAVLAAAGLVVWRSGVTLPRLDQAPDTSYSASAGEFMLHLPIRNNGWTPVTVTGAGRGGPGLRLTEVAGLPVTLAAHQSTIVYLSYRVTDCAAVPDGAWPVPVRTTRPWGTQTVYLQPSLVWVRPSAGLRSTEDGQGPGRQWQRGLADFGC
jgi:hypothetical protein